MQIEKPEDVYNLLKDEMKDLKQEVFKVICLNSRNKIIKIETVSIGTLDAAIVHPRDVFRIAIENNASSIILVHNHIWGEIKPTKADVKLTNRLIDVAYTIGIDVLDHLVVANNKFISFKKSLLI